jgi:hypothetical protein
LRRFSDDATERNLESEAAADLVTKTVESEALLKQKVKQLEARIQDANQERQRVEQEASEQAQAFTRLLQQNATAPSAMADSDI